MSLAGSSKPSIQRGESIELRDRAVHRTSIGDDVRPAQSSASSAKDYVVDSATQSIDLDASGHEEYLDGGFGWVIVGCTFLIAFHFLGLLYAWGVIQADLNKKGLGGSQLLSLIGGLNAFFTAAFCLPTSFILRKYGPRIVGLVGVSFLSLSLFLCSFATDSLGGLIVLQGCCAGIANGALFMTVYPLPSQFFMRKRGLATGITSCGGGIGGAAWSVIVEKLISKVGLSWTYRVLALSTLVLCLPAAYILRPGVQPRPTQPLSGTDMTPTPEKSIFKSSMYLRVVLTCVIVSWPFFIPPFYLPQYAVSIGMTASQGALFSALYNISSGIGRIGFGYMADMLVGNLTSWIIALLSILLSSLTVWPFSVTFASVAGFSIWCGLGSGGFFSLQSSIVGQVVGNHRIHQAIGWIEMAQSFGGLIGPLTAGLLLEKFGGTDAGAAPYKPTMYVVGGSTAVASLLALSVRASYTKKIFVKA